MGMFAAPNTSAIMNSVPAEQRGVSSGMRATFQNSGMALSMALYFTILILGLLHSLPTVLGNGLIAEGVPANVATQIANMPPTAALFAAFLGYNPMGSLLSPDVLNALPVTVQHTLLGTQFFPQTIAPAVMSSLHIAFYVSAVLSIVAAVVSALRGKKYVHEEEAVVVTE